MILPTLFWHGLAKVNDPHPPAPGKGGLRHAASWVPPPRLQYPS